MPEGIESYEQADQFLEEVETPDGLYGQLVERYGHPSEASADSIVEIYYIAESAGQNDPWIKQGLDDYLDRYFSDVSQRAETLQKECKSVVLPEEAEDGIKNIREEWRRVFDSDDNFMAGGREDVEKEELLAMRQAIEAVSPWRPTD
jgi:hypothetical protein